MASVLAGGIAALALACFGAAEVIPHVGAKDSAGGVIVTTEQSIHPAGKSVAFHGRPVDLAMSPEGKFIYAKSNASLIVIDAANWSVRQNLKYAKEDGGASMHGIVVSPDGKDLYVTLQSYIEHGSVNSEGTLKWEKRIPIPGTSSKRDSYPCGIALLPNNRAAVCLSMNNTLAIVNLSTRYVEKEIPVGIAPYGVAISSDGATAYVTNWGGASGDVGKIRPPNRRAMRWSSMKKARPARAMLVSSI